MSRKPSFHEDFSRAEEVKAASDRGFGLTVGGILLLIAAVRAFLYGLGWVQYGLGGIGLVLVVLGLLQPQSLSRLNRAWTRLGLLMFKFVNPVVLGLIYGLTIVPIGRSYVLRRVLTLSASAYALIAIRVRGTRTITAGHRARRHRPW